MTEPRNPYLDGYSQQPTQTHCLLAVRDVIEHSLVLAGLDLKNRTVDELVDMAKAAKGHKEGVSEIRRNLQDALDKADAMSRLRAYLGVVGTLQERINKDVDELVEVAKFNVIRQAGL